MRVLVAVVIALSSMSACKQRGTVDIQVAVPDECIAPTHVAVYLMRGATCGDCACGDCLIPCTGDDCTIGCDGGYCTIDEFESGGITASPSGPGTYAVAYQFVAVGADDIPTEVAMACIENVDIDSDGTSDAQHEATAACCYDL
jgi:hypothetical protein